MIIIRKIEVYVADDDKERQKELRHTVYMWRDLVRRAANTIVAHKFVQQNVRDFMYIQEDIRARFLGENGKVKFNVNDILEKTPGNSEQNTTYRVVSQLLKGKVPSDIYSCLNQIVSKTFKETVSDYNRGIASIRSYKNNVAIPFSARSISNIHKAEDGRYYFTLFGIPFACRLGRDRSSNATIIDRCLDGMYKICSSSLQINDERRKMFLLLCVDIPKKDIKIDPKKTLYALLDVKTPIVCCVDKSFPEKRRIEIGSAEEFLYRRLQIQSAVRRCQANNRYAKGGKGRRRKTQAIEHWHDKEQNYVTTKIHTYSRMLVDAAVANCCGNICLLDQKRREAQAKEEMRNGEPFLLRNWSYFGMKEKISYKAKIVGVEVIEEALS